MNEETKDEQTQNNENPNTKLIREHIIIKEPKLLRIKKNELNNVNQVSPNLTDEFQKENKVITQRIKDLKILDQQLKEEANNERLQKNLTSFYKNPFCYMDYLVKKYFKEKGNLLENYGIKKEIGNTFSQFCHEIEQKIHGFTQAELFKLKKLEKQIDKKLHLVPNKPNNEFSNLNAEPITTQDKLNIIFNPSSKTNNNDNEGSINTMGELHHLLTSKEDAENLILNDPTGNMNKETIFTQALACLRGDKIVPPKNSFLSTNNLELKDINKSKLVDSKNIKRLQDKAEWYNAIHPIPDFDGHEKIKEKNKKSKEQEKERFYYLIHESEKQLEQINKISKENDQLINFIKQKVDNDFNKEALKVGMKKLSIYKHNLEQLQKEINDLSPDQICINYDEMKNEMEENYNYILHKNENFLKGKKYKNPKQPICDEDIDELYKKYSKKSKKVGKSVSKKKIPKKATNPFLHNYFYKVK